MFQTLESRRLLSAAVEFEPTIGVLTVTGNDKPNRIEVAVGSAPLYTLDVGGTGAAMALAGQRAPSGNYVNVFVEGRLVYQSFFRSTSLREISMIGAGGDDSLIACNFESNVNTFVFSEAGDDRIEAIHFGARTGATQIFAGDGDDFVRTGGQSKVGFLVWGEGHNDTIVGSSANDTMFGDVDDKLFKGELAFGDDVIYGGAGDDFLCGCDGSDAIYGQDGNDFLDGQEGADFIDGGAGDDFAMFDPLDEMINIELTTK